jgi:hypothetical protein
VSDTLLPDDPYAGKGISSESCEAFTELIFGALVGVYTRFQCVVGQVAEVDGAKCRARETALKLLDHSTDRPFTDLTEFLSKELGDVPIRHANGSTRNALKKKGADPIN